MGDVTNFPVKGGTEEVSLSNTQYRVWRDLAWLQDLRESWPQIWGKGGNVLGNEQYRRLLPVVMRDSGDPDGATEEKAIRVREAWAARHYGNTKLAGVVAQLKWFVVGRRGAGHMRDVIETETRRLSAKEKGMGAKIRAEDGTMQTIHSTIQELLDTSAPLDAIRVLLGGAAEIAGLAGQEGDEAMATLSAAIGEMIGALPGGEEEDVEEEDVEEEPGTDVDVEVDVDGEEGAEPEMEPEPDATDIPKGWIFARATPRAPAPRQKSGQAAMPAWAQREAAKGIVRRAPVELRVKVDGEKRLMVATSSDVDRYGDIVDVKTIRLDAWKRSPVLLYGHNPSDPQNHIGSAANIEKKVVKGSDGKSREAVVYEPKFDLGGSPEAGDANLRARLVARQFEGGMLRTCSIGFNPDWSQTVRRSDLPEGDPYAGPRGLLFKNAEIIECSLLPIPANPNAESI